MKDGRKPEYPEKKPLAMSFTNLLKGLVLGLVSPVSVYYAWVRWQVLFRGFPTRVVYLY